MLSLISSHVFGTQFREATHRSQHIMRMTIFILLLLNLSVVLSEFSQDKASVGYIIKGIQKRKFTCEEVITDYYNRAKKYNESIGAVISLNEQAIEDAKKLDDLFKSHKKTFGRLHCVPVLVKDNIDVQHMPTTAGVVGLRPLVPQKDAEVVAKLREEHAIIIGKANMASMADSGTTSISETGGTCKNPYDRRRSCAGSSGGSGAGIAAGFALIALGTDTEGSVLGPANFNNIFGLRPPQGYLSDEGVYPAFMKQDVIGPMARRADDALIALDVMKGTKTTDSLFKKNGMKGVKVGVFNAFYKAIRLTSPMAVSVIPDKRMVNLHMQAFENMAKAGAKIIFINTTQEEIASTFIKIIQITSQKSGCSTSCLVQVVNNYLKRYPHNSTYRNASDLANIAFPQLYKEKLTKSLSEAQKHPADICNAKTSCKNYMAARAQAKALLYSFLEQRSGEIDLLAAPIGPGLPFFLPASQVPMNDSVTLLLNPYTGDPSVSIPLGLVKTDDEEAPNGVPSGVHLVAKNKNLHTLLKFSYAYQRKYYNKFTEPALEGEDIESGMAAMFSEFAKLMMSFFKFMS